MSRSAVDATRFTATSPHAYSKPISLRSAASNTFSPSPQPRSHSIPSSIKTPPGRLGSSGGSPSTAETAAQKVARLRAAHDALKSAQVTTWDKIVVQGRVIADRAHTVTAYGLIGLTVICGGFAIFSVTDMIIYNRRKRKVYYAEQRMIGEHMLADAYAAAAQGTADDYQIRMINHEKKAIEYEQVRKGKRGPWKAFKSLFTIEGLSMEDNGTKVDLSEGGIKNLGAQSSILESISGSSPPEEEKPSLGILQAVEDKRRDGERELQERGMTGGPLDAMAEQAAAAGKSKSGWTSWITSK